MATRKKKTKIKLTKMTPVLMVPDVDEAIAFYRDVLDFELRMTIPATGPDKEFALLENGTVEWMLQSKKSLESDNPAVAKLPMSASIICYMDVEGIEQLYQRVKGKYDISKPLHKASHGATEFYMRDPYGYILGFSEHGV